MMRRRSRSWCRFGVVGASIAVALIVPTTGVASLSLVETDTLAVGAQPHADEATSTIFVINDGASPASVAVSFSGAVPTPVQAHAPATTIGSGEVKPVPVMFTGLDGLKDAVTGALVVSGGGTTLARAVEVTPALEPARDWPRDLIVFSFLAALALGVISVLWIIATAGVKRIWAPAPGPQWSLDSWATTLTAAGALLGTVLGSVTFPDLPKQIDKNTLVTLNLFFGLLLVAGPFLFQVLRRPKASPVDQAGGFPGWNITLLLASCVIYAAVAGEIATLGLLFWEILGSGWKDVVLWASIVVEILAAAYFLITIPRIAATDWPCDQAKADTAAAVADRRRMKEFARILWVEMQKPDELPEEVSGSLGYLPSSTAELVGGGAARPSVTSAPRWSLP